MRYSPCSPRLGRLPIKSHRSYKRELLHCAIKGQIKMGLENMKWLYTHMWIHQQCMYMHLSYKSAKNWEISVCELRGPLFIRNFLFFLFLDCLSRSSSPSRPTPVSSLPAASLFLRCWNMLSTDQKWTLCRTQQTRHSLSWVRARLLTGKPSLSTSTEDTMRPGKSWQALTFKYTSCGGGGVCSVCIE